MSDCKNCAAHAERVCQLEAALEVFQNRRKLAFSLREESRHIFPFVESIGAEIDKILKQTRQVTRADLIAQAETDPDAPLDYPPAGTKMDGQRQSEHATNRTAEYMRNNPPPARPKPSPGYCTCGHPKSAHIYGEGACRPGFVCQEHCPSFYSGGDEAAEPVLADEGKK